MSKKNDKNFIPPHWTDKLLEWRCPDELFEEIQGALHELFEERVEEVGERQARKEYIFNVLGLVKPFAFRRKHNRYSQINYPDMFSNYFKIALRNLRKQKFYSSINILGLSIGMTCCILIFLYVKHELSYDTFHTKASRIYRLVTDIKTPTETIHAGSTSSPMGPNLKRDFPEVQQVVRILYDEFLIQKDEQKFQEDGVLFADGSFFEVFSFSLLKGDPKTALQSQFSIVLTEKAAEKYFGKEDPVGKTLLLNGKDKATVTGIAANVPENSHFKFSILLSMTTLTEKYSKGVEEQWDNFGWYTYLLLPEDHNPATLEAKFPAFIEKHIGSALRESNEHYSLLLEPLTNIYLRSERDRPESGSLTNVYVFSIIAGFILLIACINFMNLAMARSAERAKEVGIRKVIGAIRTQLTFQFLSESVLLSLLAAVFAVVFIHLLLPAFNALSGKEISADIFNFTNFSILFLTSLGVGIIAGLHPAFVLSGFKPIAVLKGRFTTSSNGIVLRKALVIFQFSISIALIVGTLIIYQQLNYMRSQQLGFQKEQMLIVNLGDRDLMQQRYEILKREFASLPGVRSVSTSSSTPSTGNAAAFTEIENKLGDLQASNMDLYSVDYDFLNQYQIKMVAGRGFSKEFATDSTQALLVNEAAVTSLGYNSPEQIIGKRFSQWGRQGKIIGVIKNFHLRSLRQTIGPLTIRIEPRDFRLFSLNIKSQDMSATLAKLEQQWKEMVPQRPFNYYFLDESFNRQYQTEERFGQLFLYFSGLAIFIACLGLLGLTAYTTLQRTKEIGIRKVLGASVPNIIALLSKEFLQLVLVALVIATPVAWYVMHQWLADFAYRTDISWWIFVLAGLAAFLIAVFTISYQAIKAALANPVRSLRSE